MSSAFNCVNVKSVSAWVGLMEENVAKIVLEREEFDRDWQCHFVTFDWILSWLDALYDELSRSSSMTQTAMLDIEKTYQNIINEVQDQRDQLVKRLETVKKRHQTVKYLFFLH